MSVNAIAENAPPAVPTAGGPEAFEIDLDAKPQLRNSVTLSSRTYRGELWWVLSHQETGENFRFNGDTYRIISQFDGHHSIAQFLGDNSFAANAEDLLILIQQLDAAGVLSFRGKPFQSLETSSLSPTNAQKPRGKNPLAIKIPLWDPDKFLESLVPLINAKLVRYVKGLSILLCLFAGAVALQHFQALAFYTTVRAESLANIVLLLFVYPFVKAFHELAHALVAKYHGGEVHEMGVMLLVFFPVPYVDASSSNAFPDKHQRISVASAGIIAELILAALAILIWANVKSGVIADVALSIALIGGLSTLLFNGNPLLRFDGYFVFSDYLEIPNLASRSRAYALYLFKQFMGIKQLINPVTARHEAAWFVGYYVCSSAYRLAVLFGIVLYLIHTIPLVGCLLAIFAIGAQLVVPSSKAVAYLATSAEFADKRMVGAKFGIGVLIVLAGFICFVPVPNWHSLPAVVQLPESSMVRASEAGTIERLLVSDGSFVEFGQTVAELRNEALAKERDRLRWRITELEAKRAAIALESPNEALQISESLRTAQQQLADANERLDSLNIKAPATGKILFDENSDWQGRFIRDGHYFAYVVGDDQRSILTAAPEAMIDDIRSPETRAFIRGTAESAKPVAASITTITPASTNNLAYAALGQRYGGTVAVDSRDDSGRQTLERIFHVELTPDHAANLLPGTHVFVRFEHANEPLFNQISAAISRLLMREIRW